MNLKKLVNRRTINSLLILNGRLLSSHSTSTVSRGFSTIAASILDNTLVKNPSYLKPTLFFKRYMHCSGASMPGELNMSSNLISDHDSEREDEAMNEFLSRFVWTMRGKLSQAYPDCDKQTINGMLLVIVEKVVSEMEKGGMEHMLGTKTTTASQDFSEDLWKVVWEVGVSVLDDMKKEQKKEKMKRFLLCEEVQEMCRFAGEAGIRGDLLRELRFKWAREKMEESEFYEGLEDLRRVEKTKEKEEAKRNANTTSEEESVMSEEKSKVVSLPKRHGKIKYKIYGLELSDPKWTEVADKIHERGEIIWPHEPKPISGKCKLVTENILSLKDEDDPSPLLAEWIELLQPSRIDWITLLDKLAEQNTSLYLKVAELLLGEQSFQGNVRDYSKLIEAHAEENRLDDINRILKKMNENGIAPDLLTATVFMHIYSKTGNLEHAREEFERLRSHGFLPDAKIYTLMIMAYVNAGQPKLAESLMREMEEQDIKPTEEIYMALLRSFAQSGDVVKAGRLSTTMQFAGFEPTLESCTLLVEAHGQAGDPDQARSEFDLMIRSGLKPDDRCIASMIAAYEKKNLLDKALNLLLQLEKVGYQLGPSTCTVLIDWLGKLQLVDEAEQLLGRIAEQGDAPPFKVQISLCDMYARARIEKKALQALGVVEAKKTQVGANDFERIINGLIAGGFVQDAQRVYELMEAQGFAASENLKVALMASQAFNRKRPNV